MEIARVRLEGRRRLQKLVFPDGFIYDKNNEHIEPKRVPPILSSKAFISNR